jgi:putative MATE family efflux protein
MVSLRRNPHDREILRLAVPALGALAAEPLYVLADTAVVGHLGTPQLAGLAVASTILLTTYSICIFLAYGTTSTVARLLGSGDHAGAAHHAVQALWLAALLGAGLGVVGLVAAEPLVDLLGASGEAREAALTYLRISLAGLPAMLLVLAGVGYLRGLQDTRTPLVVALVSATGNLVLELVLVFGLGFGIGASALSTVVAQWGAAAVYLIWVGRAVRHHATGLRPHRATLARLGVVARDLFVRTLALRGAFLVATAVAVRIGTPDAAAHQIAFEIVVFLALVLDAIAIAGQALIGRYLGATRPAEARAAARRMVGLSTLAATVLGVVVLAVRPWLPDLFTTDPLVRDLVAFLLLYVALMQPLSGVVFALDGVLIGAGDLAFLRWAMLGATAVFVPLALLVLVYRGGLPWLWASLLVLLALRAAAVVGRFATDAWLVTGPPPNPSPGRPEAPQK